MSTRDRSSGTTYVLVDGENIDATLGQSILGRRPRPEERPRWDRLLQFARDRWGQEPVGLFFLAANNELPMSFVQALLSMGYRPVPLAGAPSEKVVDIAIQRTLVELRNREADVMLVSNDGDFVEQHPPVRQLETHSGDVHVSHAGQCPPRRTRDANRFAGSDHDPGAVLPVESGHGQP